MCAEKNLRALALGRVLENLCAKKTVPFVSSRRLRCLRRAAVILLKWPKLAVASSKFEPPLKMRNATLMSKDCQ